MRPESLTDDLSMLPGGGLGDDPCGPDCALHKPRLHQTPERTSDAPRSTAPIDPPPLEHVWVVDEGVRSPGLLKGTEWVDGYERCWVVYAVITDDGWDMTELWVPAEMVERV